MHKDSFIQKEYCSKQLDNCNLHNRYYIKLTVERKLYKTYCPEPIVQSQLYKPNYAKQIAYSKYNKSPLVEENYTKEKSIKQMAASKFHEEN